MSAGEKECFLNFTWSLRGYEESLRNIRSAVGLFRLAHCFLFDCPPPPILGNRQDMLFTSSEVILPEVGLNSFFLGEIHCNIIRKKHWYKASYIAEGLQNGCVTSDSFSQMTLSVSL